MTGRAGDEGPQVPTEGARLLPTKEARLLPTEGARLLPRRGALLLPLAAAGCSTIDGLLTTAKDPLPGKRESVTATQRGLVLNPADARRVTVPPPADVAQWPQPGGAASHVVGNVAVGGFAPAWRASIGEGGGYRRKITAQPIVIPGHVVTMDSDGMVSAFELGGGRRAWRTDTQGEGDRSTNVGGGVSFAGGGAGGGAGGMVHATTGRGELLALDAGTGAIRWRKPLGSPARSAATVADGRLLVLTLDDRLQSFTADKGERQWGYQANAAATTLLGQAAPAFADGIIVAGFGSGDLVALRAESGALIWSDSLSSGRGRGGLRELAAIRALPVIDQGLVFAIGGGGLLVGLDLRSGRRLWEREVGGLQTPWLAGDWLYVQTADQTLAAIGRDDGQARWVTELPRFGDEERKRDPLYWTGPVMAASKLILAGSNEHALSVDPVSGSLIGQIDLSDAAAVAPVAAAGMLFLVSDDGTLQAFR